MLRLNPQQASIICFTLLNDMILWHNKLTLCIVVLKTWPKPSNHINSQLIIYLNELLSKTKEGVN